MAVLGAELLECIDQNHIALCGFCEGYLCLEHEEGFPSLVLGGGELGDQSQFEGRFAYFRRALPGSNW